MKEERVENPNSKKPLPRSIPNLSSSFDGPAKNKCGNTYNILVLGETGSGKSTFINYLASYFWGGSIIKPKLAIPAKYLKPTESVSSETTNCTPYKFTKDRDIYYFIDTPGLSNTQGLTQDNININKILRDAESLPSLSAILFVINGTTPKATVNMKNVYDRMRGVLPDDVINNIIVVFTHCIVQSRYFDINSLPFPLSGEFYHMQNTSFSSDPNTPAANLESNWKLSMNQIENLINYITKDTLL